MKNNPNISILTSLYRSQKYLESFILNYLEIDNIEETELIIIHNDPIEEEKSIIEKYRSRIPNLVYNVVPREPLYTSWNKAISFSTGEYLAMWSVDDRRTSDSLRKQAKVLDENIDCMIVSGNYYKVFKYGDTTGYLKKDTVKKSLFNKIPKFNNGCFLMWRKCVHEKIGYFDEQFKIGGDWEFWARVTYNFKALSSNVLLGYYLRISDEGLSKKKFNEVNIENQIIHMRYYYLYTIDVYKYIFNRNIALSKIKNSGAMMNLKFNRYSYVLTVLPSFLFFWIPNIKKKVVRLLYDKRKKNLV